MKFIINVFVLATLLLLNNLTFAQQSPVKYQHVIIYGQSLSIGEQSYPILSTDNVANNYKIGNQIWSNWPSSVNMTTLTPLVATYQGVIHRNKEANILAECPLIGAVNHIQLKTNSEKIIATSCGVGGKTIEELSKEYTLLTPNLYTNITNALRYAMTIATQNNYIINCPAIFWMQGEYNYLGIGKSFIANTKPTFDKVEYKNLLVKLKNNMQTDIQNAYGQDQKPVFITYQTGAQYTTGRYLTIGMAQLEASNENNDIICAGPVYQMTDRGGHLDPNGYRWYGELFGKVYYKTQILKENFKPLQPKDISRTENLKKLKIQFLVPQMPLVLDTFTLPKTPDYGFEIYKNGSKQLITDVSVDGDCVYLTSSTDLDLNSVIDVVYAGPNFKGNGNLRDNDDYTAFYNYIDLDKKNSDNSFFYPRDSTSLRPSFEPKDTNGNVIYNKPYPLYNFSVAFYYRIARNSEKYVVPNLTTITDVEKTISNDHIYFSGSKLYLNNSENELYYIEIFDLNGQLMAKFETCQNEFSLSNLVKGNYIVKTYSSNNISIIKIKI